MYNDGMDLKDIFRLCTVYPTSDFEDFLSKFPGCESLPYPVNKLVVSDGNNPSEIPENENLPQSVQDIIEQIKAADSVSEKATIAHSFSNAYIHNQKQAAKSDKTVPFEKLANDPKGDCDDYANFTKALLIRGGVNPENIYHVGAMVSYDSGYYNERFDHAFIVIPDGDEYLLLDNNAADVITFDPSNPIVRTSLAGDDGSPLNVEAMMDIEYVLFAVDGRNIGYMDKENIDKAMEFINKKDNNLDVATEEQTEHDMHVETDINMRPL